jgi:hypothetical protein
LHLTIAVAALMQQLGKIVTLLQCEVRSAQAWLQQRNADPNSRLLLFCEAVQHTQANYSTC